MTPFRLTFIAIDPSDGDRHSRATFKAVVALGRWLARYVVVGGPARIGAQWHDLADLDVPLPDDGEPGTFANKALDAAREADADLVLIPVGSGESSANVLSPSQRVLVERASIPILLMPVGPLLPPSISTVIVPMSGESPESPALQLGLRVAYARHLPLDIVHVTPRNGTQAVCPPAIRSPGDHLAREYPRIVEQLIAQGSPFEGEHMKRRIREFSHRCGSVGEAILSKAREATEPLIVLEWSGQLGGKRAPLVKHLIKGAAVPLLLTKASRTSPSHLLVGRNFPCETPRG